MIKGIIILIILMISLSCAFDMPEIDTYYHKILVYDANVLLYGPSDNDVLNTHINMTPDSPANYFMQ